MPVRSQFTNVAIATLLWLPIFIPLAPTPMTAQVLAQTPAEREREQRIIEGVYLNNQAWSLMGSVSYDLPAALEKFQTALAIFRQYGAKGGEANSLEGTGAVYLRQGDHQRALQHFQQTLALRQTLDDKEAESYTRAYLGDTYTAMKQPAKALEWYLKALKLYQDSGAKGDSHTLASLLQSIGGAYFRTGQYQAALSYYQQILPIYDRGVLHAQVLNNMGVVHINMGNYAQALAAYHTALDIIITVGNCYRSDPGPRLCLYGDEAAVLNNLAAAYFNIGDYKRALEYSGRATEIYRKSRLQGHRLPDSETSPNINELQVLQDTLGQNSRTLTALSQELTTRPSVGEFFMVDPTRFGKWDPDVITNEALSLNGLAQVYAYLGKYDDAVRLYTQARAIYQDIKAPIGESVVLNNIGNAYISSGKYTQAIAHYQQSLAIYRNVGDRAGEANTLNNMGSAYSRLKQPQNALTFYNQALALYRQVGNRAGEATALSNLGRVYAAQKQYIEAEKQLVAAVQAFDGLRSQLKDTEKIALLDTQQATYNTLQQTLVAQNQPGRALEIAERGRARAFVELLASKLQVSGSRDQVSATSASQRLQSMTLSDIKQVAKDQNATLVEYTIVRPELLYIWVIKPTGEIVFKSVPLPAPTDGISSLSQLVNASRAEDLSAQGRGLTFVEDVVTVAQASVQTQPSDTNTYGNLRKLHALLIAPIAPHLPKKPNDRVIIIPQGELFLVPFAALQDAQGKFLIETHTLVTAPAIQVLQLTRQQRLRQVPSARCQVPGQSSDTCNLKPGTFLIVGNPTMPQIGNPPQQLSSLPGAETEAKTIATLLGTQPLIGNQARKSIVLQQITTARLIHLATHGLLDDFKGLGVPGAIALAPDSSPSTPNALPSTLAGLLTASEILDLNLSADLVVLSACDTGRGRVTGDGVVGLSRSLISAGVPSVIVSLWKVSDDSTSFLMAQFYQNLQQPNTNKAQALRQAMLTTQKQYPDPKDWAAFTLIGEAE